MSTETRETFELPDVSRRGKNLDAEYVRFSRRLLEFSDYIGFNLSGRGWGYHFEGIGLIDKDEIDIVLAERDCGAHTSLSL